MRAKQLYETGRFEEAAQLCRAILSRNAQDSEANHLLGLIFYRQGQNRMAVDFLQRAHAADESYSVRDGINIARYALKMMRMQGTEAALLLPLAVERVLGDEALEYLKIP